MRFRNKLVAGILAGCLSVSVLASAAMAADATPGSMNKRGDFETDQIWLIDTNQLDGDLELGDIDAKAKEYSYKIRVHYDGTVKETTGKAKLGDELPWLDEKLPTREYNKKNYVLTGVKGPNYVTDKAADNVFDLYYKLDADEDACPDALQKGAAKVQDFVVKTVYSSADEDSETNVTVETVLHDNETGDQMLDAIDIHKTPFSSVTYKFVRVDAASIFVTNEKASNQITLYYEAMPEAEPVDDTYAGNDGGSDNYQYDYDPDICPINGQPSWICNGLHDHAKMLAEMAKNSGSGSASGIISGGAEIVDPANRSEPDYDDPVTWCQVHQQPAWICSGQH